MNHLQHTRRMPILAIALMTFAMAAFAQAEPPPGPPWPVNYAQPKVRPASDAPEKDFAYAELDANAGPIGAAVAISGAVAKPKMGNKYEVYYQLRVGTKKGEFGPLLGNAENPNGQAFLVRQITCQYDWIEFYEKFDITRKDLSGMTNLPIPAPGASVNEVRIRVEPQIYDVAEKKFLTASKTPAAILVADVGAGGRVWGLRSLSGWLIEKSEPGWDRKPVFDAMAELDEYSTLANHVEGALETILGSKDLSNEVKVQFIPAVPARTLKSSLAAYNLKALLEGFAAGSDPAMKAAAQKKLDEAK